MVQKNCGEFKVFLAFEIHPCIGFFSSIPITEASSEKLVYIRVKSTFLTNCIPLCINFQREKRENDFRIKRIKAFNSTIAEGGKRWIEM